MVEHKVRQVLAGNARLHRPVPELSRDDDLYAAGLTSHGSVTVMLALEDAFELEFPDELLRKGTFATIGSIVATIEQLSAAPVA